MFLLLVASASGLAQKSPLVITGAVSEVKVAGIVIPIPMDKDNPWKQPYQRYERKDLWFDIVLHLQFCNQGEVNLIIPTSSSFRPGNTKILFLELPSSDSRVSAAVSRNAPWMGSDTMPAFLKELEKAEPSLHGFAIIEPGTCYSPSDWISVRSGYKLGERPSGNKFKPHIEVAIPEHSYFKIQYSLSMKDSLPVSEAKRRWSSFGKLLTTADGDFFFETDVIINKLPD